MVAGMSIFGRMFGGGQPVAPLPYDEDSPEGLAARWVRWVAAAGPTVNPVADTSGANAGINQPDDVFFLAGTFGGEVARKCAVPAGRPLFFPAFNMWEIEPEGAPQVLPRAFGSVRVDGEPADVQAIGTPVPFEVSGSRFNPVTRTSRPVPMVVWGLWKRLEPLSDGGHTVTFAGGDGHGFRVGATYRLTVG